MFGYDSSSPAHFYTEASTYDCGLVVTQFQEFEGKTVEVPILYDVMPFTPSEAGYSVYKLEVCGLLKSMAKYDHLPMQASIHHTYGFHGFSSILTVIEQISYCYGLNPYKVL